MSAQLLLSASDPRPMYQQIVDQITARVMAGDWLPGQALPSIRELAADSGVSVITVKRAYEDLERAGLIATRQGKGSVVAERPDQARALLGEALERHLREAVAHAVRLGLPREALHQRLDGAIDAVETESTPTRGNMP
ncbi:MAG: GntR family transcriptional regulator [Rhodanobacteraceae bacterium]|nr:GntR family transcriptional regulator [Rhodanobacteraceae bacterium]